MQIVDHLGLFLLQVIFSSSSTKQESIQGKLFSLNENQFKENLTADRILHPFGELHTQQCPVHQSSSFLGGAWGITWYSKLNLVLLYTKHVFVTLNCFTSPKIILSPAFISNF